MNGLLMILKAILTLFVKDVESSPEVLEKKETPREPKGKPVYQILFKNDSERLKQEYEELKSKNLDLFNILQDIAEFCFFNYGKYIRITMIYRTQEEQDDIYKNDLKYQQKKFQSPHQVWAAVDIRSKTFENHEIKEIEDYLNDTYNLTNYFQWTARNHTVGLGFHFHVQYVKK